MTLIVGWIACDNKGDTKKPSALYFGSDSRYSWGAQTRVQLWEKGICGKELTRDIRFLWVSYFC